MDTTHSGRAVWTCPVCGRQFLHRNASHSCAVQEVEAFFAGRARPLALFRPIREYIVSLGDIEVAATKSQVSFAARTRFAWVWLPQQYLPNAPPDALVLTFDLDHKLRSRRIKSVIEVRPSRWTHHLVMSDAAQFDDEVRGWLRRAYKLASEPRTPRATRRPKTTRH